MFESNKVRVAPTPTPQRASDGVHCLNAYDNKSKKSEATLARSQSMKVVYAYVLCDSKWSSECRYRADEERARHTVEMVEVQVIGCHQQLTNIGLT